MPSTYLLFFLLLALFVMAIFVVQHIAGTQNWDTQRTKNVNIVLSCAFLVGVFTIYRNDTGFMVLASSAIVSVAYVNKYFLSNAFATVALYLYPQFSPNDKLTMNGEVYRFVKLGMLRSRMVNMRTGVTTLVPNTNILSDYVGVERI